MVFFQSRIKIAALRFSLSAMSYRSCACYLLMLTCLLLWCAWKKPGRQFLSKRLTENSLSLAKNGTDYERVHIYANYLRFLYPQIWACQSADFKGTPGYHSQFSEDAALHKWIFKDTKQNQNPGLFVELGALDGLAGSNTLFFERMYDWRGVLIEAQPENAKKLLLVDRKNTVKLPVGICSHPQTHIRMLVSLTNLTYVSISMLINLHRVVPVL